MVLLLGCINNERNVKVIIELSSEMFYKTPRESPEGKVLLNLVITNEEYKITKYDPEIFRIA